MSSITAIATANPPYKHRQSNISEFMTALYPISEQERRKIRLMYDRSGIETRYSILPDYSSDSEERIFFPKNKNLEPFPNIEKRMEYFHKHAAALGIKAVEQCLSDRTRANDITHLITVSCTGLAAPGLDIELIHKLGLRNDVYRTSVNFMGCYAAFHALKQADMICKTTPGASVLIVCIELCTLHFQKKYDTDNITANLLFADGAAAVLVKPSSETESPCLHIKHFYSEVVREGHSDMAWQLSGTGFLMTLSSYIPALIKKGIDRLTSDALQKFGMLKEQIERWAIHPGGKKILEAVESALNIPKKSLTHSYEILKNYGNMSSPTILYVLKDIMDKDRPATGEHIFAAGFGPGLIIETAVLEVVV